LESNHAQSSEPFPTSWRERAFCREAIQLAVVPLIFTLPAAVPALRFIYGREVRALLATAWILWTATGLGLWAFRPSRGRTSANQLVSACGLGLGLLSFVMFLLAVLQLWRDVPVFLVFTLLALLSYPNWTPLWRGLKASFGAERQERWTALQVAGVLAGAMLSVILLLHAFLPPMSFDALEYHLGVPWAHWQNGGMRFMPHLFYSNFPMDVEMLLTLAWRLGGEAAIKTLHWSFGILTSVALYRWLRNRMGRSAALLAALLFYSDVQILGLSVSAKIDLGVTFFSFLAFMSFWRWMKEKTPGQAVLTGVFTGLAVGGKYSCVGIVAIPVFAGMAASLTLKPRVKRPWLHLLAAATVVLLLFAPWAIRNTLFQGNPVFPLAYETFGGRTLDSEFHQFMVVTTDATWPEEAAQLAQLDSITGKGLQVWKILTQEQLLPTILLLLLLPVLLGRSDRREKILYFTLLLGWLIWITLSRPLPRYLVPLYPAIAALMMMALRRISRKDFRRAAYGAIVLVLLANGSSLAALMAQLPKAPRYLARQVSREELLFSGLPHFEAIEYLNRVLQSHEAKVLFVAEARGYGCKIPYALNSVYDRSILLQVIGDEPAVEKWPSRLRKAGYTHLLYNPLELQRYITTFESSGWKEGRIIREVMERLEQSGGIDRLYATRHTQAGQIKVYQILE